MEKINGLFLANANDGTIDEVLTKLPYNPEGYSLFLSTKNRADTKKTLLKLSECDEDLHPIFRDISYLFFDMLPSETELFLLENNNGETSSLSTLLAKIIKNIIHWISLNKKVSIIYKEFVENYRKLHVTNSETLLDERIIEKEFIYTAKSVIDRKKRTKIISGLKAINHYGKIYNILNEKDNLQDYSSIARECILFHTSILMIALVKFSSNEIFCYGLQAMKNRRNKDNIDKSGFLALRDDFRHKYPTASRPKLWNIICSQLLKTPFLKYGEYFIEYVPKLNHGHDYSGCLVQKKDGEEGKETMTFTTFKKKTFWSSS